MAANKVLRPVVSDQITAWCVPLHRVLLKISSVILAEIKIFKLRLCLCYKQLKWQTVTAVSKHVM